MAVRGHHPYRGTQRGGRFDEADRRRRRRVGGRSPGAGLGGGGSRALGRDARGRACLVDAGHGGPDRAWPRCRCCPSSTSWRRPPKLVLDEVLGEVRAAHPDAEHRRRRSSRARPATSCSHAAEGADLARRRHPRPRRASSACCSARSASTCRHHAGCPVVLVPPPKANVGRSAARGIGQTGGVLCALGDLVDDVVVWLGAPDRAGHRHARAGVPPARRERGERRRLRRPGRLRRRASSARSVTTSPGDRLVGRARRPTASTSACGESGRTGTVVVLVHPGGERTMLADRGARTELAAVPDGWLARRRGAAPDRVLARRRAGRRDGACRRRDGRRQGGRLRSASTRRRSASSLGFGAARFLDAPRRAGARRAAGQRRRGRRARARPGAPRTRRRRCRRGQARRRPRGRAAAGAPAGGGAGPSLGVGRRGRHDRRRRRLRGRLPRRPPRRGRRRWRPPLAGHRLAAAVLGQPGATLARRCQPDACRRPSTRGRRRRSPSGGAVVALESTIFSNLGLPAPANAEALERCLAAVRRGGAVPAVTAVLDGVARVGLGAAEHERILGPARKAAERDLAVAVAQRWPFGATTVSASLALAHRAGVRCSPPAASVASTAAPSETGRRERRPRGHRRPPGRHGVRRRQGLPRPRPHAGGAGAHRRAGARLAPRRLPGLLHAVVRLARCRIAWRRPRRWPPCWPTGPGPTSACSSPCRSPRPTTSIRRRSTPRSTRALAEAERRRRHRTGGHAVRAGPHRRRDRGSQRAGQPRAGRAQRRGGGRDRRGRRRTGSPEALVPMRWSGRSPSPSWWCSAGLVFAGWWFLLRDDAPPEAALVVRDTPTTVAGAPAPTRRRHVDGAAGRRTCSPATASPSCSPARRSRRPPSAARRRSRAP